MKPIFDLYRQQFATGIIFAERPQSDPTIDITGNGLFVLWGKCGGGMSRDALLLALCHELGHMAGGPPYLESPNFGEHSKNQSAEGEADFFAASSCLPALFSSQDNSSFMEHPEEHPALFKACSAQDQMDAKMRIMTRT